MRQLGIFIAPLVAIAAGVGIGCIPVVNENLHWNIWFVVPVSGFILGLGFGWLQFGVAWKMGTPVRGMTTVLLGAAAVAAYLGTDFGTWLTLAVPVVGIDGVPDGDYPLRELVSFGDYMSANLASSEISGPGSSSGSTLEFGMVGTMISFFADLTGCAAGAVTGLWTGAGAIPFCERCALYTQREQLQKIALVEEAAVEQLERMQEITARGDYGETVTFLNEAAKAAASEQPSLEIHVDERTCRGCNRATLLGKVLRKQRNEWKEIDGLAFRVASSQGETSRLLRKA